MSTLPVNEIEPYNETADDSFFVENVNELQNIPSFEFSSPISSIASNCSGSPQNCDPIRKQQSCGSHLDDFDDFVSLEELKSQISPPSDEDNVDFSSTKKVEFLETIFEDCYLETPPGTPTNMKAKNSGRHIKRLFKENDQYNNKTAEN